MLISTAPKTIYWQDYQPPAFRVNTIHLRIDLDEEETRVRSVLSLARCSDAKEPRGPLVLNGEGLDLKRVILNGEALSPSRYSVDNTTLTLHEVPDQLTLETEVIIHPEKNTRLTGLYRSRGNYCTQCEPHGFRCITYFLDRPDVMARFTTTITADKTRYPFLLSNGNLIAQKELSGHRHCVQWEDPSLKPSYLFALVAGDFDLLTDQFITQSGRRVDLRLYVEKGFGDQGAYAFASLKEAMRCDEKTFGREYDLDIYMIVAVSDFNMGAMENKGLNIFNTKYILANPETATDQDYTAIKDVIGHEYFHNWSGNRVTCRDWFQITLKEGLTVLRDQLFTEDETSQGAARIDTVNTLRQQQFPEDAGPLAHPIRPKSYIEINNFYTNTVYRKGAEVIRMIRTLLGKEAFRLAMDEYFSRYDGQAVTTEDFIRAMEISSGRDLSQFCLLYYQAGTPLLTMQSHYDVTAQTLTLTVQQTCPPTPGQSEKAPFYLPLAVGLVGSDGKDMIVLLEGGEFPREGTYTLIVKEPTQTFRWMHVTQKPTLSLLRHFSAPVQWRYPYTDEELLHLFQYDSDAFARWEAGQEFASRQLSAWMAHQPANQPYTWDERFIKQCQLIIQGSHEDHQVEAMLLILPSERYLLQRMAPADITQLHRARESMKTALAKALCQDWRACYEHHLTPQYQYNNEDMGKRYLKNVCLDYLVQTGEEAYRQLAYSQFQSSRNMTDTMGALTALNNATEGDERARALEAFYACWKAQPLIVNRWFLLQSSAKRSDTLEKVKQLMHHPAFDIRNPNKVYALLGGFANNIVCFHEVSGEGYRFIAEQVLAMDADNPQVAARLIQPLTQWSLVDEKRQSLMQAALQSIAQAPRLSRDIYELVTKSMKGYKDVG